MADTAISRVKSSTVLMVRGEMDHEAELKMLLETYGTVDLADSRGRTSLMLCAYKGREASVAVLISHGADVGAADNTGRTPLMFSVVGGHVGCARLLLSHGSAVDAVSREGVTTLMLSSEKGNIECVRMVLAHGAGVDMRGSQGVTSLMLACYNGHAAVVALLLSHGADTNLANAHGVTSLMLCCHNGHHECARLLLEHGTRVDAGACGQTALILAAARGHLSTVQLLSIHGADRSINAPALASAASKHPETGAWMAASSDWITPLHHVSLLSAATTTRLLREGADLSARARPGAPTPLQLAQELHTPCATHAVASAAAIVLRASEGWSVANHQLRPMPVRTRALELLRVGHLLASERRFEGCANALLDVWISVVIPHAL